MRFLRQNTACRVTVGPFFDKTDGVTPEVALTVTAIKVTFMVDDGNVPTLVLDTNPTASGGSNDMAHVTGDDAGFYDLELTAANTNFLGRAMLALTDAANHCPVFHEFMILPAMIYDSLILGTDRLDANVTHIADASQTARDLGASVLLSSGTGAGQVDLSSGKVLLQATQTGVTIPIVTTLTDAPADSSGVTTLLSRLSSARAGFLDNLSAGAVALESSLQALITTVGAAGAGLTATASAVWSVATRLLTAGTNIVLAKGTGVTGLNDLSAAQVNAEVDTALADYDGPTHTELTTELATADDATLAAIAALNNLSQANVRSAVGLASANLDTQLAAIDTKTTNLPSDPADASDIAGAFSTVNSTLGTIAGYIDTEVAAIKAKTDNLPLSPAASSDIPTAEHIADLVWTLPFPSTGIIDDCNRTDEGPPPSANWVTGIGFASGAFDTGHRIVSNTFRRQSGSLPEAESRWIGTTFGADCEFYVTVVSTGVSVIGLGVRVHDIADGSSNGYFAHISHNDTYNIYRLDNGAVTLLAEQISLPQIVTGNKYGVRILGSQISLWADTGTGWKEIISAEDFTYAEAGIPGIYTESTALASLDDVGGGSIPDISTRKTISIANAVWDEDIVADHQDADSAGKKLSKALILYEGS